MDEKNTSLISNLNLAAVVPEEIRFAWLAQSSVFHSGNNFNNIDGLSRFSSWWFLSGRFNYAGADTQASRKFLQGLRSLGGRFNNSFKFEMPISKDFTHPSLIVYDSWEEINKSGECNRDSVQFIDELCFNLPKHYALEYFNNNERDCLERRALYISELALSNFLPEPELDIIKLDLLLALLSPIPFLKTEYKVPTAAVVVFAIADGLSVPFDGPELYSWWLKDGCKKYDKCVFNIKSHLSRPIYLDWNRDVILNHAAFINYGAATGIRLDPNNIDDQSLAIIILNCLQRVNMTDEIVSAFDLLVKPQLFDVEKFIKDTVWRSLTPLRKFRPESNPDFPEWWEKLGKKHFSNSIYQMHRIINKGCSGSLWFEKEHLCLNKTSATPAAWITKPNSINLIGITEGSSGIAEDYRQFRISILARGSDITDISVLDKSEKLIDFEGKTNLFVSPPFLTAGFFARHGKNFLRNRKNIAFWQWELSEISRYFLDLAVYFDEIWTLSTFTAASFSKRFNREVFVAPLPVFVEEIDNIDKSKFGIKQDDFCFLFGFDGASFVQRKNPVSAVHAFKLAFPNLNEKVKLIIKTHRLDEVYLAQIKQLIECDRRIVLIEDHLDRKEMVHLLNCCDCFVSLHRAEGFGRLIAEAMFLGKPVIVSAYSGNMDYTFSENSFLVDGKNKPVIDGEYLLGDFDIFDWFDPSIVSAAEQMQIVFFNPSIRNAKAQSGQAYIKENYSSESLIRFLRSRNL